MQAARWQLDWLLKARRPDADMLLAAATCHRASGHPEDVLPAISDALGRSPKDLQLHLTAVSLCCQVGSSFPMLEHAFDCPAYRSVQSVHGHQQPRE